VDREGGVDLDAIAAASERIGRRLDLEGFDPGPYELEVTSPGVERPLRERIDFARRIGERVRVRTATPVGGARNHRGRIVAAGENEVLIETESGERSLRYEAIASARTVFDWGNEVRAKGDGR
jgi:ribosome maturation factor RimP